MPIHPVSITGFRVRETPSGLRVSIPAFGGTIAMSFHLAWLAGCVLAAVALIPKTTGRGAGL